MTLSFDPHLTYVQMVMELTDERLTEFFGSMGIEIDLSDDDEGIIFDCEA